MAARAGHDLVLEAERWNASAKLLPSAPKDSQLRANVDARSLQVREGRGGVKPLTDSDREEIRRNLEQRVLRTDQHPEITFASTAIDAVDGQRWQVVGDLTIAGTTSTVRIPVELEPGPEGTRMRAAVTIAQSSFGIKPFSAMMGALKVADDVEIRAEVCVRPSETS
jgi:polyisoprenoid-binding protein YceI